ncbi:MAG TPA: tetratricopeptide repeat protein [Acidobacteriaceae bacterium]|nr:tetratricopeptide repeat protein [Acidobacteriaceae bacterium]
MKIIFLSLATAATLALPAGVVRAQTAQALLPNTATADSRQLLAKNYELKGDIARAREQYASAMNWYLLAVRSNPDSALYVKLGIAEMKLGDMEHARRDFAQAVKRNPANVDALNNLGAVYCLQKKYRPSIRYLKQALALDETKAATHLNLAEAWMGQKQIDRAMTEYARALELDADILNSTDREGVFAQIQTPEQRAMVDFMIAKAYIKRGNVEGALDYLRRAREQHFKDLATVWNDPAFARLWKDPRLAEIVKPKV